LKILRREAGEEARKRVGMDSGKQTKPRHPWRFPLFFHSFTPGRIDYGVSFHIRSAYILSLALITRGRISHSENLMDVHNVHSTFERSVPFFPKKLPTPKAVIPVSGETVFNASHSSCCTCIRRSNFLPHVRARL
jgi:hypothetical protein